MTELVNRAVLPAIPSIRALAAPWDCQSPTVASLESPACQDAGKALARDPHTCVGILSPARLQKNTSLVEALFIPLQLVSFTLS